MPGKKPGICPSDAKAVRDSIAALDVNGPQGTALIKVMLAHHVALSSTLANFEGALPQPEAVAQRMFDLEDPKRSRTSRRCADLLRSGRPRKPR